MNTIRIRYSNLNLFLYKLISKYILIFLIDNETVMIILIVYSIGNKKTLKYELLFVMRG